MNGRRHTLIAGGIWLVLSVIGVAVTVGLQIMPVIASREAEIENAAFVLLTAASVPVMLLVVVPMAYAAVRFRAGPAGVAVDGPPLHGHARFELAWVAASCLAVLGLAIYGSIGILDIRGEGSPSVEVMAVASQWKWEFEYPGSGVRSKELVLPVGEKARITIIAKDVIHDFSVPAFGVKMDAVPGRQTHIDVTPTFTGEYGAQCAELCGFGHTRMLTLVRVLEPNAFRAWLTGAHEAPE